MILLIRQDSTIDIKYRGKLYKGLTRESAIAWLNAARVPASERLMMTDTCNTHYFGDTLFHFFYSMNNGDNYLREVNH